MLKKFAAKIWKKLPSFVRILIIRATQRKFTASAGAVVTDKTGKVLLLDHLLRPGSGWGMPGGFIEHDEQPDEALRREVREETGLDIENIEMITVRTLGRHIEFIFRAEAEGKAEAKSPEIIAAQWFQLDKMPEEMTKKQKEIIKGILKTKLD